MHVIAAAAHVNPLTIYRRFGTREGLYDCVWTAVFAGPPRVRPAPPHLQGDARLLWTLRCWRRRLAAHRDAWRAMAMSPTPDGRMALAAETARLCRDVDDALRDVSVRGRTDRHVGTTCRASLVAGLLGTLTHETPRCRMYLPALARLLRSDPNLRSDAAGDS